MCVLAGVCICRTFKELTLWTKVHLKLLATAHCPVSTWLCLKQVFWGHPVNNLRWLWWWHGQREWLCSEADAAKVDDEDYSEFRGEQLLCPSHLALETLPTAYLLFCVVWNCELMFGKSYGDLCGKADSFQRLWILPRGSPAKSIKVKYTCRLVC